MRVIGSELLKGRPGSTKFILNDSGIVFFPGSQQHRDVKVYGLSYEDDYRGNAVAGVITQDRVEIRFHNAFSDERMRSIWAHVLTIPEITKAGLGPLYYQGRAIL
jgi:hypothetical protein